MESIPSFKTFILAGSILGFLGVALGAFGSHFLKTRLSVEMLAVYEIGIRYQFYHALALILVGLLLNSHFLSANWIIWSGYAFIAGILIFSGSLYLLAFTGIKWWGALTPIGGTALLLGWLFLILSI